MADVTVKLFGPQAQLAGEREIRVPIEGERITCARLRERLGDVAPRLTASLPGSRFAVNQEFAGDEEPVGPGDEVALIGMVSGG